MITKTAAAETAHIPTPNEEQPVVVVDLEAFKSTREEVAEGLKLQKPQEKEVKQPNKPKRNGPPSPLTIKMPDGRVFKTRQDFVRSITDRLTNAKTEEEADQLEYYRMEYYDHLNILLERLSKEIEQAREKVSKCIKIRKDPKKKKASPGIKEILAPLRDKGIVREEKGRYAAPSNFNLSDSLVSTANRRIELILKSYQVSRKINGFRIFDRGTCYAFQLKVEKDSNSGRQKYRVYNLVSLSGKPDLKEGSYLDFEAPNRLRLCVRQFEDRLKKREKESRK